jgi:hypothetical protein
MKPPPYSCTYFQLFISVTISILLKHHICKEFVPLIQMLCVYSCQIQSQTSLSSSSYLQFFMYCISCMMRRLCARFHKPVVYGLLVFAIRTTTENFCVARLLQKYFINISDIFFKALVGLPLCQDPKYVVLVALCSSLCNVVTT